MQRRKFLVATLATPTLSLSTKPYPLPVVRKPFTVKAGKDRFNEPILYQGVNPNLVKISAKDSDGQLAVFEYEGLAKIGPPVHMHLHQDEIFYVIEGEYLFQVGDERQSLKAGDSIFLPRNIAHTWLQLSEKGKLIYLLQPAGQLEDFFMKMNTFKRPPTLAEEQQISLVHGVKTIGPPITH